MANAETNGNRQADAAAGRGQASDSPFVCNMGAISDEERPRHLAVTSEMRQAVEEVRELPDGYALLFAASQAAVLLVGEFIARERACCPFFTFELVSERDGGPLWLRLRGREGVKEFILAELDVKP